jgi:hypothetical protein
MTPEQLCIAIERLCLDAGFTICGTCDSEGIYGEITVHRVGQTHADFGNNAFNWNIKECDKS